jgi:hypothetical protein
MKTLLATLVAVVALLSARVVSAQEAAEHPAPAGHGEATEAHGAGHAPEGGAAAHEAGGHETPGPVLRPDMKNPWPGVMLIVIGFMFLAAIGAGIASAHAPPAEQPPPTHSHDEPPGASHHHGSGGTINPEPYHGHASEHGHH